MKKSISFIGALFLGSAAFAQVNKTDSTNKTLSRKVLTEDVKDLPVDNAHNQETGMSKGRMAGHTQKTAGEGFTIKGKGGEKTAETEKQNYTIKMSNPAAKATTDSTAPQNAKNNHIKMPSKKD